MSMKPYAFVFLPVMALLTTIFLVVIGSANKPIMNDKHGYFSTNSSIKLESDFGQICFSVVYIITGMLVASISFLYFKYVQLQTSNQLISKLAFGMSAVSACGFIWIAYFQILISQFYRILYEEKSKCMKSFGSFIWSSYNPQQGESSLRQVADSLALVSGNVYMWLVVIINSKDLPDNCTHGYVLFLRGVIALMHTLAVANFGYKSFTANSNSFEYYFVTGNLEATGTYFTLIFLSLFAFDLRRIKCVNFAVELQERSPEEKENLLLL